MQFSVDLDTRRLIETVRALGEKEFRPAGLEADRRGAPNPVEDPFFDRCIARGEGRTRWASPKRSVEERGQNRKGIANLLVAEELA